MATLLNLGQVTDNESSVPVSGNGDCNIGVCDAPRPEAVDGMRASSANPPGDTTGIHNPVSKARQFLVKITNL